MMSSFVTFYYYKYGLNLHTTMQPLVAYLICIYWIWFTYVITMYMIMLYAYVLVCDNYIVIFIFKLENNQEHNLNSEA